MRAPTRRDWAGQWFGSGGIRNSNPTPAPLQTPHFCTSCPDSEWDTARYPRPQLVLIPGTCYTGNSSYHYAAGQGRGAGGQGGKVIEPTRLASTLGFRAVGDDRRECTYVHAYTHTHTYTHMATAAFLSACGAAHPDDPCHPFVASVVKAGSHHSDRPRDKQGSWLQSTVGSLSGQVSKRGFETAPPLLRVPPRCLEATAAPTPPPPGRRGSASRAATSPRRTTNGPQGIHPYHTSWHITNLLELAISATRLARALSLHAAPTGSTFATVQPTYPPRFCALSICA